MFKVTIEETKIETKVTGNEWKVVAQKEEDGNQTPIYGYTPEIERRVEVERKVFEQTVEQLDIAAVIATINGLKKD
jgi:hypothetical protein